MLAVTVLSVLALSQLDAVTDAMPGVHRVASAQPVAPGLGATFGLRYGFTESVLGPNGDDVHHRLGGRFAVAVAPLSWLRGGLQFDGRFDLHQGGPSGSESGWTGTPRLSLRASDAVGPRWAFGGELGLSLPGGDAPSVELSAASLDFRALASFAPAPAVRLHANVGAILDNSAAAVDQPERLSPEDQLALMVSDSSQLWLAVGADGDLGRVNLFGEIEWRALIGEAAPPLGESPLGVSFGARQALGRWQYGVVASFSASSRPTMIDPEALFPIQPRVGIEVWLGYRFDFRFPGEPELAAPLDEVPPPPPPAPQLRVTVVDAVTAARVSGALVTGFDRTGRITFEAEVWGDDLRVETTTTTVELLVTSRDHQQTRVPVALISGDRQWLRLALAPELPSGELRGQVTNARAPIAGATVRVLGADVELTTDPEGRFAVELPPGRYRVRILARGHRAQLRPIRIEDDGVTILNVELYRYRGRR